MKPKSDLDHAIRVIGVIMVTGKTPNMEAAVLLEGEFYKIKISMEKVVEGEQE